MRGTGEPSCRARKALAAVMSGTATRTASQPRRTRRSIWASVASTSRVSVLVMLCTITGAPPPMVSLPSLMPRLIRFSCMADLENLGLQQKCRQCLMLFQQASQVLSGAETRRRHFPARRAAAPRRAPGTGCPAPVRTVRLPLPPYLPAVRLLPINSPFQRHVPGAPAPFSACATGAWP